MLRIIELRIRNTRGIRELDLELDGQNLVIWGPNGSGKSAVVDALDFLLTGSINRLAGRGTAGITLGEHGPHIEHEATSAVVEGVFRLPAVDEQVTIRRSMSTPNDYQIEGCDRALVEPFLDVAARRQHVLTRRDILNFVIADPRNRAEQIQALLNLSEVEDLRRSLVTTVNRLDGDHKATSAALQTARSTLAQFLDLETYSEDKAIEAINKLRGQLGGEPLAALQANLVQQGVTRPAPPAEGAIPATTLREIEALVEKFGDAELAAMDAEESRLRQATESLRTDADRLSTVRRAQLLQLGLGMLEGDQCPLCETPWPQEELRQQLERRLAEAQAVRDELDSIEASAAQLREWLSRQPESLDAAIKTDADTLSDDGRDQLQHLQRRMVSLQEMLQDPLQRYEPEIPPEMALSASLRATEIRGMLTHQAAALRARMPEPSLEQLAWDRLTQVAGQLKAVQPHDNAVCQAEQALTRAKALAEEFQSVRYQLFEGLFESVRDRFVGLYKTLHAPDEDGFSARLQQTGTGVDFHVNFHGRGMHPPHALHSEGHQDSMGICLFLALSEHLTEESLGFIVLDDVVMSIDAEHRRGICRVLRRMAESTQLLITTHDRTWTNQLRTEGLVRRRRVIELFNWNLATGPLAHAEDDIWERIDAALGSGDVARAAFILRRGLEQFMGAVCDALRAKVTFKMDGRWELGDVLPGAVSALKAYLKEARAAAHSWDNKAEVDRISDLQSNLASIVQRSQAEQWAVNANVHYNNWVNMEPKEFRPVVEAFSDLCALFLCPQCGGLLAAQMHDAEVTGLRCPCAKAQLNLVRRTSSR